MWVWVWVTGWMGEFLYTGPLPGTRAKCLSPANHSVNVKHPLINSQVCKICVFVCFYLRVLRVADTDNCSIKDTRPWSERRRGWGVGVKVKIITYR